MSPEIIAAFTGKVADFNSSKIFIGGYDRVAVLLRAASITSGTGAFAFKGGFGVGPADDPTMSSYAMMIDNVANTNAQFPTRVASKTLSANGDKMLWVDPNAPITHLEIDLDMTTDGTYAAYIIGFRDCE